MSKQKKEEKEKEIEVEENEEVKIPDLPEIFRHEKEVVTEEIETIPKVQLVEEKEEELKKEKEKSRFVQTINTMRDNVEKIVSIEKIRPEIEKDIDNLLKEGRTLIIGKNIGKFAERLAEKGFDIIARDTSLTFISPKAEVNNSEILEKMELKPFSFEKMNELKGPFINVILLFALKGRKQEETFKILERCKQLLYSAGLLFITEEFVSGRNILFDIIKIFDAGVKFINAKLKKKEYTWPIIRIKKISKKLELRKFKVFSYAGGIAETHVLAKRLSAFLTR